MNCSLCKREYTKNMDDVLSSGRYTYVVDDTDHTCESCDARHRASDCVRIINTEMSKERAISSSGKINDSLAFLSKRLSEYKAYWTRFYTDFLKGEDRDKYRYWLNVFDEYIEKHVTIERPQKEERTGL